MSLSKVKNTSELIPHLQMYLHLLHPKDNNETQIKISQI